MAKKFLNFTKLFGVQKFAFEAPPWLVLCGQWLHLVETTSQVYPSLQDAQNSSMARYRSLMTVVALPSLFSKK